MWFKLVIVCSNHLALTGSVNNVPAKEKPKVVFAPHVETSTGVMFPDDQVKAIADAAHSVGAVFVLDCIASGTYWVDMKALGIDVVITAPQKGWSGHA